LDVLTSGWVTTGPLSIRFEEALADYLGARSVVSVSSCTAAIELALRALRLPAGSPVLTPALTFCGAVQAIFTADLRPRLVDVDPTTFTMTPETVERAVHRIGRPAAVVVQHHAGYPIDTAAIASAAGLPMSRVVEDAAHGLGARFADGVPVGGRGFAVCLSFYATKNLPIGEGGAVVSEDPELAAIVRRARLHGMSRDSWARYLPGGSWRYDVEEHGLKANLTDLQAAIGVEQLRHLTRWQRRRAELAAEYDEQLTGVPGLALPARPASGGHAWHLYQVRVEPGVGQSRDALISSLTQRGIGTSVHFIPVNQLTDFRRRLGEDECRSVPITDSVAEQLLSLPMHPGLGDDDVARVCSVLASVRLKEGRVQ